MTRDYNKQRRDDVRPSSRNSSPGRPGDKQFPRPARPRLNRETVDRAWETGANTTHADYRTRNSNSGGYGRPSRNSQPPNYSSAQNGRKPFGNRQESNRANTPYGNTGPRSRSFDADRRNFDDQHGNDQRNYSGGPRRNEARPGFRDNRNPRPEARRSQFGDNNQGRGYQRRDSEHYDRQPRERDFDRNSRSPRNFDRNRSSRPPYNAQQPDTQNPRWRSRPANSFGQRQHFNERGPQNEQFEGDYERFNTPQYQRRFPEQTSPKGGRRMPETNQARPQIEERHVTRLPDGRVLKGPRPVQRRNAQFWTDVAHETEDLVEQVNPPPTPAGEQAIETLEDAEPQKKGRTKARSKPRTRTASAVARGRKSGGKREVDKKPRSAGPKPSQRGFKWPTS